MKGVKSAFADLEKQFNRLNERLENLDSVLKVKVYSISHYWVYNCFILIRFGQTINTKNYNSEMQMEKQKELFDERIERLERLLDSNHVNLLWILFELIKIN